MIKIVIDPGHGGSAAVGGSSANNATGPNGLLEKTATLQVAKAAEAAFVDDPVSVTLTRSRDVNLGIAARAAKAKDIVAEVFVSIHFNAPDRNGPPAQGTETWVGDPSTARSRRLAQTVQRAMVAATGYRDRGVKSSPHYGVIRNSNHHPNTAHCLVEVSFLERQAEEEARLRTPAYIDKLGRAVRDGVIAYCLAEGLIETETARPAAIADVEDAAAAAHMGLLQDDAGAVPLAEAIPSMQIQSASATQRLRMAQEIVDFEARRDPRGKLTVYYLRPEDGGGRYEVAGINDRYHRQEVERLVQLIEAGRHDEAERLAVEYIAKFTDTVAGWTSKVAVECYLRDSCFNRGPGGAAWMLQAAVGVVTDGSVGPQTRAAVAAAEINPRALLKKLRATRERYEEEVVGRREVFWRGLVNRWNKALLVAESFLDGGAMPEAAAAPLVEGSSAAAGASNGSARAEVMSSSATIVATRAAMIASDLEAAKAEMLKRYLAPLGSGGMRAFAATTSPDLNVVGVGIGEKEHEGAPTGVMAVKLFVRKKFPVDAVPEAHRLPKSIGGVPVDVEEVGRIVPLLTMPNPRQRFDIVPPGCSIGYDAPMAGTLGALVRNRRGEQCILSNNHVLANEGRLPAGSPIFQQGLLDLSDGDRRKVATLSETMPLASGRIDAALARCLDDVSFSNEVLHIRAPNGAIGAREDMVVHKFGRTTSYTVGMVTDLKATMRVEYETQSVVFADQILIKSLTDIPFSRAGDSGSLILNRNGNEAVGLLFAGSTTHTLANHITDVLGELGATL
jgi:N-acetylmuramoyl-L-alanine amidase/lysozyme family protein